YLKILKIFLDDGREYLNLLKQAAEGRDWPKLTIEVHALKTSTSTVGATALSEAARSLEDAGRRADEGYIALNLPAFREDLAALLASLEGYLAQSSGPGTGQAAPGPEQIASDLRLLRRAFDETDGGAIDSLITKLQEEVIGEDLRQDLDRLARHFLEVEYDEAIALIDRLLAGLPEGRF
ncbi:MAG: Hpt domain-containing protein, partial [Deltaproteobacteria bacterium]|nr:Hpt domain-containing protein [Deltaproteobacteria bacterium]